VSKEIIYGLNPVIEAIDAGKEIEKILIQRTMHPAKEHEIRKIATLHEIPFQFVPREKLNRITTKNHQGIIAMVSAVTYSRLEHVVPDLFEQGKNPLLLILDKITDVRNLGSIARSAFCAGVDAIVLPSRGSAMVKDDAVKTSAGALNRIKVCRESNLKESIRYLKESGFNIVGATEKADKLFYEANYKDPLVVVMGSEDKGISEEYLKLCNEQVKIPQKEEIGSLNVSVATGIVLFEVVRQRL